MTDTKPTYVRVKREHRTFMVLTYVTPIIGFFLAVVYGYGLIAGLITAMFATLSGMTGLWAGDAGKRVELMDLARANREDRS